MKKGLFNRQYGLLSAVISGRKTVTRRICKNQINPSIEEAKWKIGEVIAIAQSYEDMANEGGYILANMLQDETTFKKEHCGAGWRNAMFTKADLMPHRIMITNVRVERLQDISDDDCLKEGVYYHTEPPKHHEYDRYSPWSPSVKPYKFESEKYFCSAKNAFKHLIEKVSGKGTWKSNPYVFVYDFELIR